MPSKNSITIKDFILDSPEEINTPVSAAAKPPASQYEVVFSSDPDFAVRRKTARTSVVLVCIVSQNQIYLKKETGTGSGSIEQVTVENLTKFLTDIPADKGIALIDSNGGEPCKWITQLTRGVQCARKLMIVKTIMQENLSDYLKYDMIDLELCQLAADRTGTYDEPMKAIAPLLNNFASTTQNTFADIKTIFDHISKHSSHNAAKTALSNAIWDRYAYSSWRNDNVFTALFKVSSANNINSTVYQKLMDLWGIEGIRQILDAFYASDLTSFPCANTILHLFTRRTNNGTTTQDTVFDLKTFKNFIFAGCVRQGYADDGDTFWSDWGDYLDQQISVYGSIKDKYPEHLTSEHKRLTYILKKCREKLDEQLWQQAVERMKEHEAKIGDYVFICPKTQKDLIDEGCQQGHCVGQYGDRITSGACQIYFMRRAKTPDTSFVTIQVNDDNTLGQCRTIHNGLPGPDTMDIIQQWHTDSFRATNG